MKTSDYIAKKLSTWVDHVFVGNGGCVVHLLDSLSKTHTLVATQTEQGASIAAEAYARLEGFGIAVSTSGPGFVNMIQGIACAYYDSIPAMYIVGSDPVDHLRTTNIRQKGFQEMPVVEMVKGITKYAIRITDVKNINREFQRAYQIATSGRKGPVLIEIPDDIQRAIVEDRLDIDPIMYSTFSSPYLRKEDVDVVASALEKAKRPLIVVGGGCREVEDNELEKLLISNVPFVYTWASKDMFNVGYANLVGGFGISDNRPGNIAIQEADVILVLGCKLDYHQTGANQSKFALQAKIFQVDIDAEEFDRGLLTYPICADVSEFLKALNKRGLSVRFENWKNWNVRLQRLKATNPICLDKYREEGRHVNPYVFMDELSKYTEEYAIVITDTGATLTWTMQGYPIRKKQGLFSAFNHSPMGYSICAAIGAQIAQRDNQVVCIIGDGGLAMNVQELETIFGYNLPIKIFVIDNCGYGIMKQTYDTWLKKRTAVDTYTGLPLMDIERIAKAFEIPYYEIVDNDSIEVVRGILKQEGPIICRVAVDPNARIVPKLESGKSLEQM